MLELQNISYSVTDPTGTTDILKDISITIPDNIKSIGEMAFANTPDLDTIEVESGNSNYTVKDGCLIHRASKKLLRATNNAIIPQDGSITEIESSALSMLSRIEEAAIPNGVLSVPVYFAIDCKFAPLPCTSRIAFSHNELCYSCFS